MIVTIIASILGIFQVVGGGVFNMDIPYPNPLGYMSMSKIWNMRASAAFVEPDQYGKYSMAVCLFFIPLLRKKKILPQVSIKMINLTVVLSLISLVIAHTRSAWLGFVTGLVHYSLFNIRKARINIKLLF